MINAADIENLIAAIYDAPPSLHPEVNLDGSITAADVAALIQLIQ